MTPESLIKTIDAIGKERLQDKRVLVRIDAEDETRLDDAIPTLTLLADSGARTVIAAHWPDRSLFEKLSDRLGRPVETLDEWQGEAGLRAVARVRAGQIAAIRDLALEPGE